MPTRTPRLAGPLSVPTNDDSLKGSGARSSRQNGDAARPPRRGGAARRRKPRAQPPDAAGAAAGSCTKTWLLLALEDEGDLLDRVHHLDGVVVAELGRDLELRIDLADLGLVLAGLRGERGVVVL